MKQISIFKFLPAFIWFLVVMVLLFMPSEDVPSSHLFDILYFDKWVHAGIFGLLALLCMLPFAFSAGDQQEKLRYFILIAVATSLWGLTTEFIQKYWTSGRNFDLFDWAADSVGAFIAFMICKKKGYLTIARLFKK